MCSIFDGCVEIMFLEIWLNRNGGFVFIEPGGTDRVESSLSAGVADLSTTDEGRRRVRSLEYYVFRLFRPVPDGWDGWGN